MTTKRVQTGKPGGCELAELTSHLPTDILMLIAQYNDGEDFDLLEPRRQSGRGRAPVRLQGRLEAILPLWLLLNPQVPGSLHRWTCTVLLVGMLGNVYQAQKIIREQLGVVSHCTSLHHHTSLTLLHWPSRLQLRQLLSTLKHILTPIGYVKSIVLKREGQNLDDNQRTFRIWHNGRRRWCAGLFYAWSRDEEQLLLEVLAFRAKYRCCEDVDYIAFLPSFQETELHTKWSEYFMKVEQDISWWRAPEPIVFAATPRTGKRK
jgi:hypothetical protein